jgi:uncharacterized protein (DUF1697 family)
LTTFISILRGINVGGHNSVKMEFLLQLYAELGFSDIQHYIQSGNVIFRSESTDILFLEKIICEKLHAAFGWPVPVQVMTKDELRNALQNNPFINDSAKDSSFIHLTFLSTQPNKELIEKISGENYLPDEFFITGKTIYLYCPNGYGRTRLTNDFFEKQLKLIATTRNIKTVKELLFLAEKLTKI